MARRASFIDSLRTINPNTLVVDAGDFCELMAKNGNLKSEFIYKMMGRMRYDAVTFGERELRYGAGYFDHLVTDGPRLLMTNVFRMQSGTGGQVGDPYLLRDLGGVKVGVFGLVDERVIMETRPHVPDYVARNAFRTARETVDQFKDMITEIIT